MKLIKILLIITISTLLIGCSNNKTYTSNGISITMMKGLFKKNHDIADVYYENDEMFVIALKETYEELKKYDINYDTSIEDYIKEVFINQGVTYELKKVNNLYYFTYQYEINNNTYYYVSTIHKSNDAFWVCNFACPLTLKDKYDNLFIEWGQSIKFN